MEDNNRPDISSSPAMSGISGTQDPEPVQVPQLSSRRTLRRSRRPNLTNPYASESEIVTELAQSSPTLPVAENDEYEDPTARWVKIVKIINIRRIAPFPASGEEPQNIADKIAQYAFFSKYHDQCHWNCSWRAGSQAMLLNPGIIKNYFRQSRVEIERADEEYRDKVKKGVDVSTLNFSSYYFNGVSDIGESVVEEVEDKNSFLAAPIFGGSFHPHLLKSRSEKFRRRFNHYVENGIHLNYLYPERIIMPSEERSEIKFLMPLRRNFSLGNVIQNHPLTDEAHFHEVLVKWCDLDEGKSTWETVEISLEHMDAMLPKYRRAGLAPMDHCKRFLLPSFIRRLIIQLDNARQVHVAGLYSSYLGVANGDKVGQALSESQTDPPPAPSNWEEIWTGKQPNYVSEIEGGRLHPYQLEGVRWLRRSFYDGVNTILADEMGLGKTIQVISMLYSLFKEDGIPGPFLIVSPLGVTENWKREFSYWAPHMVVVVYSVGKLSHYTLSSSDTIVPAFNVLITNYEMIGPARSAFAQFGWRLLVVDEAHRLKNKNSKLFRDLMVINANHKILLTGTPLQNNLDELVNILHFMDPFKFPDMDALSSQLGAMTPGERTEHLQCILKGHILRRLKHDVISSLPRKTEIIVPLSMTPLQKRIYKLVLTRDYELLRTRSLINPLLHLQKISNHPYLMPAGDELAPRIPVSKNIYSGDSKETTVYEPTALVKSSAKLHLVMRMLGVLCRRGHRVLIFCHLVSMLDLIEMALYNGGIEFERLDGTMRSSIRQSAIDRFNATDAAPTVFLLSTRAGGEGINLASADTVILFDSDWNPHRDMQALARAHRIGQMNHVFIYRLVMRGTVEERIVEVARRKLALAQVIMDESKEKDTNAQLQEQESSQLSINDIFDILTTGLKELFEEDDNNTGRQENKDPTESRLMDVDNGAKPMEGVVEGGHKPPAKKRTLVYDDADLDRLLDRDTLSKAASADDESLVDFNAPPMVFRPSTGEDEEIDQTDLSEARGGTADWQEYWDNLLRRQYDRLAAQEAEAEVLRGALAIQQTRESVAKAATIIIHSDPIEISQTAETGCGDHCIPPSATATADDKKSDTSDEVMITGFIPGTGQRLLASANPAMKPEPGAESASVGFPRRSTRHNRYTAAAISSFIQAEEEDPAEPLPRGQRGRSRRNVRAAAESDDDFQPEYNDSAESEGDPDESGVDFVITNEAPGVPSRRSGSSKSKGKRRGRPRRIRGPHGELIRLDPSPREAEIAGLYRRINWNADTTNVCIPLRELASALDDVVFQDDNMTVYGFTAHERQAFLDSVMKYGLPPKGAVPPPEWLPFSLRSKRPEELFAYSNLFMKHLYNDPKVLDPDALYWSDGVPTEGVNGLAVLSRIGAMALIRRKVTEFEDYNLVPKRFKIPKQRSRFVFEIYDGGLSLLRRYWHMDKRILHARIMHVVNSSIPSSQTLPSEQPMPSTSTTVPFPTGCAPEINKRRIWSVIMRKWHERHDYYLLAGISYYGYCNFHDILEDPRYKILLLGIAEVIFDGDKADPLAERISDEDLYQEAKRYMYKPPGIHYMTDRLRVLEQALLLERSLAEVVLAYQGEVNMNNSPDPSESVVRRNQELLVKFSEALLRMGPLKRVKLPRNSAAAESMRMAIKELQMLLDDMYADLPGLPASLVCDGAEFHQPRFLRLEATPEEIRQMDERNRLFLLSQNQPQSPTLSSQEHSSTSTDVQPQSAESASASESLRMPPPAKPPRRIIRVAKVTASNDESQTATVTTPSPSSPRPPPLEGASGAPSDTEMIEIL